MNVDIVIATYNGERFIGEQLHSIINDVNFNLINKLIISDDYSTDRTLDVVGEFILKYSIDNCVIVKNEMKSGPASNFVNALNLSSADFIFFCDQDDFWIENRIFEFISKVNLLDNKIPGLIYSDLKIVNYELSLLYASFYEHERIPFSWGERVENLLFQNSTPGCAMLINKECREKIISTFDSNKVIMHDWWAMLYTSLYDNQVYLNSPTILYRQHSSNAVGMTKKITLKNILSKIKKNIVNLYLVRKQSLYFFNILNDDEVKLLSYKAKLLLRLELEELSFNERFLLLCQSGRIKSTFVKNLITKIIIMIKG